MSRWATGSRSPGGCEDLSSGRSFSFCVTFVVLWGPIFVAVPGAGGAKWIVVGGYSVGRGGARGFFLEAMMKEQRKYSYFGRWRWRNWGIGRVEDGRTRAQGSRDDVPAWASDDATPNPEDIEDIPDPCLVVSRQQINETKLEKIQFVWKEIKCRLKYRWIAKENMINWAPKSQKVDRRSGVRGARITIPPTPIPTPTIVLQDECRHSRKTIPMAHRRTKSQSLHLPNPRSTNSSK
jgi:hypothetical protein